MKKAAIIAGYLALICIALFAWFKIAHYPGANYLVGIGCALFCLGFAPAFAWIRYKEAGNSLNKIISVISFLAMFFLGVSIAAKALYWGCGVTNACIGYSFLILLIVLVIGQAVQEKDPWKSLSLHSFSILTGIVLTMVTFLEFTTIPKNTIYDFTGVIYTQNKEIQYFTDKSNSFFENFDKNASNGEAAGYYAKAQEVNAQCDSMVAFIKLMGEDLMFAAQKKEIAYDSIQNLCHAYYVPSCDEACGNDSLYIVKHEAFRAFFSENTNSRGKEVLELFFPTMVKDSAQDCSTSCSSGCCCCCNVLCRIIDLNAGILHVRMLQAETMNYLQTMQAKAMMKGVKSEE
ncbi:MAG: hypothetical protein AB9842_07130 [Bacteroidales bacterium]